MKTFSLSDLHTVFSSKFISRGKHYWRQGNVLRLDVAPDANRIVAQVKAGKFSIYDVQIIWEYDTRLTIEGYCSCPVSYNCKHVVACLVGYLAQSAPTGDTKPGMQAPDPDPHSVKNWLRSLHALDNSRPSKRTPDDPRCLLFMLQFERYGQSGFFSIHLMAARRLKTGGYGKAAVFHISNVDMLQRQANQFLDDADKTILLKMLLRRTTSMGYYKISENRDLALLEEIVATGRGHWIDKNSPALSWGEPRKGKVNWQVDEQGYQHLVLATSPASKTVSNTTPYVYFDHAASCCGAVSTADDDDWMQTLLKAPPIGPEQVKSLTKKLHNTNMKIPLPKTIPFSKLGKIKPVPMLKLVAVNTDTFPAYPQTTAAVELQFNYEGYSLHPLHAKSHISFRSGYEIISFLRHSDYEEQAVRRLKQSGLTPMPQPPQNIAFSGLPMVLVPQPETGPLARQWISFLLDTVPELRDEGWVVDVAADFPFQLARADNWYVDIDDQEDNHWFDMELGIHINGERHNLLPLIVDWLKTLPKHAKDQALQKLHQQGEMLMPLPDGRTLSLPAKRVHDILSVLVELFDKESLQDSGRMRLSQWQAGDLAQLQGALSEEQIHWFGGSRLQKLAEKLQGFKGIKPVSPPKSFKATLRDYQYKGLNWLQFLREYELGGILADDMGLGKTVQTLAHLAKEKAGGRLDLPALVVAPTSLMFNWQEEAARFTPGLKLLCLHGPERKKHFDRLDQFDLLLTTYALLVRDGSHWQAGAFHYLILDEAQFIKNSKSKAKVVAQHINARHRLCLTGTPMENHLGELWSLFDFLMPGLLGEQRQFSRLFRTPIEKHGNGERQTQLNRRIEPFLLRRKKDLVAKELPSKTEITRKAIFHAGQQDLYETIRLAMHNKVRQAIRTKGLNRSHIEILEALLKLRQVCCDPRLLKIDAAKKVKQSAKLELLMEMLPELLEEGRRILLFSQFTSMLCLIEQALDNTNIDYLKLTGQTKNRAQPIKRFENGEVPLFLISLKAGGTGLNLTAADTVIHYDPWWNPAVENQANSRAHRIGQDKPVFVYKLLTEGTVEERITQMQARKQALADAVLENKADVVSAFSQQDLEALLAPLH